ncbi:MAG: dihydrofolate reductase [Paludibacteraceae bacterium]|nr:dihydrofolate reductase [Paludibacteraceae bacterium]MBR6492805.1 dihydrofolate reductase [Paludibacteraceae bacterium]
MTNYKLPIFFLLIAGLLCGCQKKESSFQYNVDKFYDLEILRYDVPEFESLTLQQKSLLYCLSEAALWGRDILFDQNGRYNLRIRRACEALYLNYPYAKDTEEFAAFERYLKRVWFSNGIHHHYSEDKFLPEFTQEWFMAACEKAGVEFDPAILPVMFDPNVMPKRTTQQDGVDLVAGSAGNYYGEGVTQKEAEDWYAAHKDNSPEPLWIGLNSQLVKNEKGEIEERVYKVGGLYGEALEHIVFWLKEALKYVENDAQKLALEKMIAFNETGDLKLFNEYCIAWVKDLDSRVDFVNGFTETYSDPLGITGTWESMVNFKDLTATRRAQLISENAQWFEDHSTTDPKYKKEEVKGVSAKVITAAILAGDCYPATPIGINLPNANWIRKEYGSKSVTIDNLMHAYNEAAKGNGFNEEFMIDDEIRSIYLKYGAMCGDLHTDLHECVGHGSGKLMPGVSKDALKEHASTIEEARADLFGLYYLADPKLVELGLLPNEEAYKAGYYQQMMNGAMTQLVRIEPGKDIEEAHMRNRQLIANWVLAHVNPERPELEIAEVPRQVGNLNHDGPCERKHYLIIYDYQGLRRLYGELLAEIQRITSEGDYPAAKEMVETYAVKVNPELHKEVLERYAKLNLAPYKGFVNPVYTAIKDKEGRILDVKIDFSEGYVEQHLRYSRDYSPLPSVN